MNGEYSDAAVAADTAHTGRLGRVDLAGPMVAALGALGCASFALSMPPVPDHGYQFYLAGKLLDGAKLYVDVAVADMHPPLFTWMAAGLELLARALGTAGWTIYPVFVSLLVAAALYAVWKIGPRSTLILSAFVLALLPLSGPYFGQGDHLAITLALPYLAATAASAGGTTLPGRARFGLALVAALGLAMKPHFALVWVAAELYHARQRGVRSLFRTESLTIGSVFVLYLLATWIITPEFFPTLPWLLKLYPRYAPVPLSALIIDWRALLLLGALIASRLDRTDPAWNRLTDVLALAAIALYAAVLLQLKGWGYHWYPVNALSFVLIGISVRRYAERVRLLVP
ncbi:MAG TPA: hypothetical protein VK864_17675, partial [Longimicrobiales bacterium]|nr:hypothetical protein [Longimicrobiales bacterium]